MPNDPEQRFILRQADQARSDFEVDRELRTVARSTCDAVVETHLRLMADFILSNAGIAGRLSIDAVPLFGLGGPAAQARTHELLAGIAA